MSQRDAAGRFPKGVSGNPLGRPRKAEIFENAAHRILDAAVTADDLRALGVPTAALRLLPEEPTYHDALAAVLISRSIAGADDSIRELLKRLWPAAKPVEISAPDGAVDVCFSWLEQEGDHAPKADRTASR